MSPKESFSFTHPIHRSTYIRDCDLKLFHRKINCFITIIYVFKRREKILLLSGLNACSFSTSFIVGCDVYQVLPPLHHFNGVLLCSTEQICGHVKHSHKLTLNLLFVSFLTLLPSSEWNWNHSCVVSAHKPKSIWEKSSRVVDKHLCI